MAEDEQQFLLRQQQYLAPGSAPPPTAGGASPSSLPSVQKTADRKSIGSPGVHGSPKKVMMLVSERKGCFHYCAFLSLC